MKRLLFLCLMVAMVIVLVACGGRTTGASNVTHNSATLNYEGHCDPGDAGEYFAQYKKVGTSTWLDGPHHPIPSECATGGQRIPASGEAPHSDNVTGLDPSSQYEYRARVEFTNGSAAWTDSTGAINGTNYHSFTTSAAPTNKRGNDFWLTDAEIAALPTSGTAYDTANSAATGWGGTTPDLSNQDENNDVKMYAAAIVGKRNNNQTLLGQVRTACLNVRETENGGRVLALARNLLPVVAACSKAGLSASDETAFKNWLSAVRTEGMTECTNLKACSQVRPNNWGTMSLASRIAASSYLNDSADLLAVWEDWQDFTGRANGGYDFSSPAEGYQCASPGSSDPANLSTMVGITFPNCSRGNPAVNLDGAVPDDARRCGAFTSPPCLSEPYDYEGRQGIVTAAVALQRAGFAAKTVNTSAVQRSYKYLQRLNRAPAGDDRFQPWLEQCLYGTASFTPDVTATHGKIMGYTAWTHTDTAKCA